MQYLEEELSVADTTTYQILPSSPIFGVTTWAGQQGEKILINPRQKECFSLANASVAECEEEEIMMSSSLLSVA